jgi:hypothetical protein
MKKAEMEEELERLAGIIARQEQALKAEKAFLARAVQEQNGLIHVVQELFDFHVCARDFDGDDPLWFAEELSSGKAITRPSTDLMAVYREAIELELGRRSAKEV